MYFQSYDKKECCGCTACQHICNVNAITMEEDDEGFNFPIKHLDICIDCGLCEKVCPMANLQYKNKPPKVFAAYLKDVSERKKSTSGGVFATIARYVLSQGGILYGAALTEQLHVIHQSASNDNELHLLRGSKYVQSDLSDTFPRIKNNLRKGKIVYFTGTPCQVAGLKSYLMKEYANLITSDLICHGVPSQQLFNEHIKYLKNKHKTKYIYNFKFRNYETGEGGESFNYINQKGKHKLCQTPTYVLSPFLFSFINAYTYRIACYHCPFARLPRQGDITLGDFWGVRDFYKNMDISHGCSLVLLNNEKGERLWLDISNLLFHVEANIKEATKYNKNLLEHTAYNIIRKDIYAKVRSHGYNQIAATTFRPNNYHKIKIKIAIKKLLIKLYLFKIATQIKSKFSK